MSAVPPLAARKPPWADPDARSTRQNSGEWQIWLGWTAAAILHGGLLAALICTWTARLNPAPQNSAPISLVIVPASGHATAVQPKPAAEQTLVPAAAPVKIANSQPARPKPSPSIPRVSAGSTPVSVITSAPREAVKLQPVAQQEGDGFVAALPVAGNVNQPPEYPPEARLHSEQGDVLLSIHVLATGVADSVSVTQSSGYNVLDEAAAKAVWKWRFTPSTLSGQPVPSVIPYKIHFNLQPAGSD